MRENRKYVPIFLMVKKRFKNVDFKFYLDKLNNKDVPHMVQCPFSLN